MKPMSEAERFFVDTNMLLYSADAADARKQKAARLWLDILWAQGSGRLSWQVLHEFYANAIRKLRASRADARAVVLLALEFGLDWTPKST